MSPEKYSGCSYCGGNNIIHVLPKGPRETKESQTEGDSYIDQESQIELQEAKGIIENQRRQIEELNNKILSLEDRLESSNTIIDSLDWKLQSIIKEK